MPKLCAHCHLRIPSQANVCGHCGRDQPRPLVGVAILAAVATLAAIFYGVAH